MKFKGLAAATLFILSPLIAELLSSSAPPSEFFSFGGLLILALYGPGALLVREVSARKNMGLLGILMLGCAYGVLEEGVACKSFFDPGWPDLGIYSWYGRWAGVNWPWMLELVVYHAVFSILSPILIVESTFYRVRGEPWVSSRTMKALAVVMGIDVLVINAVTPYRPTVVDYLLSAALAAAFLAVAFRLGPGKRHVEPLSGSVGRLWALMLLWSFTFMLVYWILPRLQPYPHLIMLAGVLHLLALIALLRSAEAGGLSPRSTYALGAGPPTFLIVLTPVHELSASTRPDDPRGMIAVGLAAALLLTLGYYRLEREETCRRRDGI